MIWIKLFFWLSLQIQAKVAETTKLSFSKLLKKAVTGKSQVWLATKKLSAFEKPFPKPKRSTAEPVNMWSKVFFHQLKLCDTKTPTPIHQCVFSLLPNELIFFFYYCMIIFQ